MDFDWHRGTITRATRLCKHYRNTQNVRRFMLEQCGVTFKFDRAFMAWIRNDMPKTMGDLVGEWQRRQAAARETGE